MPSVRKTLFDYFEERKKEIEELSDEYVMAYCVKSAREPILDTDGYFVNIVEGRYVYITRALYRILKESGYVR